MGIERCDQVLNKKRYESVGNMRKSIKVRMVTKVILFLFLIGLFWIYIGVTYFLNATFIHEVGVNKKEATQEERRLASSCPPTADPFLSVIAYIAGVLYLFFSIAVVADELFVPALEVISGKLELSEDVAGATLMAAGGSSPELFANLVSTFLRSNVGFGAIVGSAVFNVLVVVGICAVVTCGVLELSPWPLLRDSAYYVIVLITLAVFFGVNSPGVIDWYEALILHALYWVYVFIMRHNLYIKNWLSKPFGSSRRISKKAVTLAPHTPPMSYQMTLSTSFKGGPSIPPELQPPEQNTSLRSLDGEIEQEETKEVDPNSPIFSDQVKFRSGILKQLTHQHERSFLDVTGLAMVTSVGTETLEVFNKIDKDKNGFIDAGELKQIFIKLGQDPTDEEINNAIMDLDTDQDGLIDFAEFESWYLSSKHRLTKEIETLFEKFDADKDGVISLVEFRQLMNELCDGKPISENEVNEYYSSMEQEPGGGIYLSSFQEWFNCSDVQKANIEQVAEVIQGLSLLPPNGADYNSLFWFYLAWPLVFFLYFTVPDVRRPSQKNYCYVAFLMCLCWMGFLSYFMVSWIEVIGSTFGIPSVLMGLTFLALGTSVPDMFSAIVVAKQGKGSQAVSSSVGSNVFDITVGLAIPWLLFWAVYQEPVLVIADSLFTSILGIIGAVAALVGIVMHSGWVLTSRSGWFLLVLYAGYVGWQAGTAQYGQC